jgi:hypothetical protein
VEFSRGFEIFFQLPYFQPDLPIQKGQDFMSSQWFTQRPNEEKRGPFSDSELKQLARNGELLATDFVWREGMSQAVPASKIKGLFQETPPPVPPVTLPPLPPPLVDPNNFDALVAGLVPTQQTATNYVPNSSARNRNEKENQQKETNDDVFSWYRPGDPRAPVVVNWRTFWQAVHAVGSKNKAFYFLLPVIVVVPLAFLLGIINAVIPFFFINWIILFVVCGGFGEAIFECFRLAGINNKFLSMGYGVLCGLLTCYFFLAGGLFCDYNRYVSKDDPPLGVIRSTMPNSVIWYVQMKAETMTIKKVTHHGSPPPNRFFNYMSMSIDLFIIVMMMSAGAGGGRQNISGKTNGNSGESTESEDEKIAKMLDIKRF